MVRERNGLTVGKTTIAYRGDGICPILIHEYVLVSFPSYSDSGMKKMSCLGKSCRPGRQFRGVGVLLIFWEDPDMPLTGTLYWKFLL